MRIFLLLIVFCLVSISVFAITQNVNFIGVWGQNTTLFSNPYLIENGSIWGKDVYKIAGPVNQTQVCTNKTVSKLVKQCTNTTNDVHLINRTRIKCSRINDTYVCQNVTYTQPIKTRQLCVNVPMNITTQTCKFVKDKNQTSLCFNPNGSNSNVLELRNFKMSINNGTYQSIPYIEQKLKLNASSVQFRLDIPAICAPEYDFNKAITIED